MRGRKPAAAPPSSLNVPKTNLTGTARKQENGPTSVLIFHVYEKERVALETRRLIISLVVERTKTHVGV